jgi:fructose-1,6-bisphosphatase/inositol monophosphatase family enzyme
MIPILRAALGISCKVYCETSDNPSNTTLKNTGIRDVVTGLDLEINRCVVSFLESNGIPCISEEGYSKLARRCNTFAIVDPLDGSLNYLFSLPAYCTVVGIVEDGKLVCGGVASHSEGVTVYSDNKTISYSRRYKLPSVADKPIPPAVVAYGPYLSGSSKAIVTALLNADPLIFPGFHRIGSAAHGALQYASGRFSSLLCLNVRVWDVAGIIPILYSIPGARTFVRISEHSVSLISIMEDVIYSALLEEFVKVNQFDALDHNTLITKLEKVLFYNSGDL